MRIIAGKYGGRKLAAFKADNIRPTTDRVKEVIFNKLQFDIEDSRILDLFSGTGNLAIESLSRGAQSVVAVESSSKSITVINKNIAMLGIGQELKLLQSDVFKFLKSCQDSFDIILVDPPFTKKIADEVMQAISQVKSFQPETQLFIESSAKESIGDEYGSWKLQKRKSYGDKILSHFQLF